MCEIEHVLGQAGGLDDATDFNGAFFLNELSNCVQ